MGKPRVACPRTRAARWVERFHRIEYLPPTVLHVGVDSGGGVVCVRYHDPCKQPAAVPVCKKAARPLEVVPFYPNRVCIAVGSNQRRDIDRINRLGLVGQPGMALSFGGGGVLTLLAERGALLVFVSASLGGRGQYVGGTPLNPKSHSPSRPHSAQDTIDK